MRYKCIYELMYKIIIKSKPKMLKYWICAKHAVLMHPAVIILIIKQTTIKN